jgi:hypothetical protein
MSLRALHTAVYDALCSFPQAAQFSSLAHAQVRNLLADHLTGALHHDGWVQHDEEKATAPAATATPQSGDPLTIRWDREVWHAESDTDDTIVCCLTDDGQPVALLLDDEHREALGLLLVDPTGESESTPDFFEVGHTYAREHHASTIRFLVKYLDESPCGTYQVAFGWSVEDGDVTWSPFDSDDMGGWIDVTEAGDRS